jgi:hypothetical protein
MFLENCADYEKIISNTAEPEESEILCHVRAICRSGNQGKGIK